jgi:predicted RNA methylase
MIETLGYKAKHKDREKNDFYATPPEEVANLLSREKLYGTILDNSCGIGHITKKVAKAYPENKVIATDLINRGYGIGGLDFLSNDYPYVNNIDTIIMNPPFKLITPFVTKSLEIANKKVILFARMQFLESQTRYNKIFKSNKPNRIYIYMLIV